VLSRLDLNEEIPPELYQVVARILTFVYRAAYSFRRELAEGYLRLGEERKEQQDARCIDPVCFHGLDYPQTDLNTLPGKDLSGLPKIPPFSLRTGSPKPGRKQDNE